MFNLIPNSHGKAVLAISIIAFTLIILGLYLGKISQKTNQESVVMPAEQIATNSASASPVSLSENPFDKASSVPKSSTRVSYITPQADVEIKEEAGNKVYVDNKHGFSFKFANSLTLNNSASDVNFAQFLEKQGSGNAARMVMQIFENPNNSSLEEVIKRENLLGDDKLGPKYEYFKINGRDGVKLTKTMTQTEICNDGDGSTKNRIFYFLVKGEGFVAEIHPNESCESFKKNWFDITPDSFQFTK